MLEVPAWRLAPERPVVRQQQGIGDSAGRHLRPDSIPLQDRSSRNPGSNLLLDTGILHLLNVNIIPI